MKRRLDIGNWTAQVSRRSRAEFRTFKYGEYWTFHRARSGHWRLPVVFKEPSLVGSCALQICYIVHTIILS